MAVRTTATSVKLIIDTSLTDPEIEAFIGSASVLIDAALVDSGLGEDLLENIEMWLTAHMIASTRERQAKSESAGGASITYQGETGLGLNSTMYGQQVLMLDTSGSFAGLGGKTARITAVTSFV